MKKPNNKTKKMLGMYTELENGDFFIDTYNWFARYPRTPTKIVKHVPCEITIKIP